MNNVMVYGEGITIKIDDNTEIFINSLEKLERIKQSISQAEDAFTKRIEVGDMVSDTIQALVVIAIKDDTVWVENRQSKKNWLINRSKLHFLHRG